MAVADEKTVVKPEESEIPAEDSLEGLKKNRDSILGEKKALEKRLKKFETEAEERAKKELEETGKYKELYQQSTSELLTLKKRLEFESIARKYAFDLDYSDAVLGRAQFDADGKLVEPEKFFKDLKAEKPRLFNDEKKEVVPTDTSKPKADAAKFSHIYTRKELNDMSQEEYEKLKPIITKQASQGLIV